MRKIIVCIVEDLREVREGLTDKLNEDECFEVVASFADAEKAVRELPAWQPDIIIMDINLPGMSGIECIRLVKPLCPKSQFIMFTIYEDDEKYLKRWWQAQAAIYLRKHPYRSSANSFWNCMKADLR